MAPPLEDDFKSDGVTAALSPCLILLRLWCHLLLTPLSEDVNLATVPKVTRRRQTSGPPLAKHISISTISLGCTTSKQLIVDISAASFAAAPSLSAPLTRGVLTFLSPRSRGPSCTPILSGQFLIQVKNDHHFTNRVSRSSALLFTMMDPFNVGLFSKCDADPLPPVLSHCACLGCRKVGVTGPNVPICHSPRLDADKYTAYDLWIAGVSNQSFGVVPDDQATRDQYRHLLARTRDVFNGYGALAKDGGNLDEGEQGRIDLRRMMHAAAASKDQHFRNYICNPAATSMNPNPKYDPGDYFVTLDPEKSVDEHNPVHGDEDFQ